MHITDKNNNDRSHWLAGRKEDDAYWYAADESAIFKRAVRGCKEVIVSTSFAGIFASPVSS
jgi:hypothetical protein